jgi:hypothetical protein
MQPEELITCIDELCDLVDVLVERAAERFDLPEAKIIDMMSNELRARLAPS